MSMRIVPPPLSLLLAGALLLGAGCASAPSAPSAGHGQEGGAGGTSTATGATPGGTSDSSAPASGTAQSGAAPAPAAQPGAGAGAASGNGPGQTSDERRAAIDQQLADSLGSFDAQLRTEQQRVAQERDARQAAAAAAGSAATERAAGAKSGESSGSAATEGTEGEADKPGGTGRHGGLSKPRDHSGDLKSEKASKKPDDNAGNGASAREIPDGSDDDVVARRLRQAAQQETDPELKDKLWKEYLDYKKNAQNK
jgi:hypothetical protein